jgi:sugar phosphate isomerase/epimerase
VYVSIRDALLLNGEFSSPLEGLRNLGINAVEIALSREFEVSALDSKDTISLETDRDAEEYGERLKSLGVNACAFLTACDLSCNEVESNVGCLVRSLELASILGMKAIRVDSVIIREREMKFDERVDCFAKALGEVLRRSEGLDVAMGIENHGVQGNNLAFLLNVLKRVESDRLGVTLDTGNFYWRGYPLSEVYGILEVLAPYAKHTHLKNIQYPVEEQEKMREAGWEYGRYVSPLDEGDIDHRLIVRTLARHGYRGDLCIEDESLSRFEPGEARMAVLRRDVAYVKELLKSVE